MNGRHHCHCLLSIRQLASLCSVPPSERDFCSQYPAGRHERVARFCVSRHLFSSFRDYPARASHVVLAVAQLAHPRASPSRPGSGNTAVHGFARQYWMLAMLFHPALNDGLFRCYSCSCGIGTASTAAIVGLVESSFGSSLTGGRSLVVQVSPPRW